VDLTRDEIVAITGGRAHGDERDGPAVARVLTFDSRTLAPGTGFVALRDAHDGTTSSRTHSRA
jgi:UDP-N-acetylmuramyl pentapeptide synthase